MKKALMFLSLCLLAITFLKPVMLVATPVYTPKIKNIRIRQTTDTGASNYKIVVIVKHDDNDEVDNVETQLTAVNPNSPAPVQAQLMLSYESQNSVKNKKRYVNNTLSFAGNALGEAYNVTVTMKDINGNTIGAVESFTVTVEENDSPVPTATGVRIAEKNAGYEIMAFVTDADNLVASVRAQVTPVTAGAPQPSRPTVTLSFDTLLPDGTRRFANYGGLIFSSNALGYQYAVTLTLLDANGQTIGEPVVISTLVVN